MTNVTDSVGTLPRNSALVIFDCDGVLVNSEPIANRILARALTHEGYPCTFEESILRFVGRDLTSIIDQVEGDLGRKLSDGFCEHLRTKTYAAFRKHLEPVSGISGALDRILFPKCVASSGAPEKIQLSLTVTGLRHHFGDALFSTQQVHRGKPYPDLFLHAALQFDIRPHACVVIEDSVPGVTGARAAGMKVFGYSGAEHASSDLAHSLSQAGAEPFFEMDLLPGLLINYFRKCYEADFKNTG